MPWWGGQTDNRDALEKAPRFFNRIDKKAEESSSAFVIDKPCLL
jgi:hypothetical protein